MEEIMFKTTIAAAALGLVLAAAPAAAGTDGNRTMEIEYRDLNLDTVQGQEALDRRIDNAARKVCGVGAERTGTRIQSSSAKKCFAEARAKAHQQMASIVKQQQLGG